MSKYIPVEAEKWAEMVQAMALAADLMAENKRLAAENERIRKLFAETERLMLLDGEYEATNAGTYARLTAENERLRKAGDELAKELATAWAATVSELDETAPIAAWLAAKEGRDAK